MTAPQRATFLAALGLLACRAQVNTTAAITIDEDDPSALAAQDSGVAPAVLDEPAPDPPGVIRRSELDRVLAAGGAVLVGTFEFEAVHRSGRFVGWRILAVKSDWRTPRRGDVVMRVNGKPLETPKQVQEIWERLPDHDKLVVLLERDGEEIEVTFDVVADEHRTAQP